MSLQFLADGLIAGALIGLGAIGVTLTYAILRFANFAHGEFVTVGAYAGLALLAPIAALAGGAMPWKPLSFGWPLALAAAGGMAVAALLAVALDALLFSRLRERGGTIVVVMASFGASMALRALVEFTFTSSPTYFSRAIQIAMPIGLGIRVTPDQIALLAATAVLVVAVHLALTRTQTGRAMRAVSQNPALARVVGIDVATVVRITWIAGGALAGAAGIAGGLLVQIRPTMGFDLLLPLFSAAILGGIGSVPGAVAGGLIVGLAEAATVQFVGAEWRAGVAFVLLVAVLLVRPTGLFGKGEA